MCILVLANVRQVHLLSLSAVHRNRLDDPEDSLPLHPEGSHFLRAFSATDVDVHMPGALRP